ncbi:MAG: 2-oxoglutarate dehydrogenase E1 component [Sedimentisphaerales bacterium]|nr:2-oxoglutarate dehydrogenase E1 component [Sedimentisphaerales bacterium]
MDNLTYIEDLYLAWQRDPAAVGRAWDAHFRGAGSPDGHPAQAPPSQTMAYKQSRVDSLLWAYRDVGYLYARLNPLGGDYGPGHHYLRRPEARVFETLTLEEFGLDQEDLDTVFSAGRAMRPSQAPLREIVKAFRETYCGSIGVEFLHIQDKHIRRWLIEKMESTRNRLTLPAGRKRIILEDLLRTEALEHTLHQAFVGQKRFSLEGSEAIIPGLHFLVDSADRYGIEDFVMGTTHRGRLSILATILHMTPREIFSRFEENFQPGMAGGSGDVKYHIGYETDHILDRGGVVHISVAANASHLESIDAIVQGKTRALQDRKRDRQRKRIVPILLHGDAAFSGQGVVAETFNLSSLAGYTTGGTIHIIINNQIGFTTSVQDERSSCFPTDMAKALPIPIFHINGDDPEALVYAADLALQFRQTFGIGCVLDVFCYRRYGHNEADEPSFTQPRMYQLIAAHPSVATIYGEQCADAGVMSKDDQASFSEQFADSLKQALHQSRAQPSGEGETPSPQTTQGPGWAGIDGRYTDEPGRTAVAEETLRRIGQHITTVPEGFHIHRTLGRILERKRKTFDEQSTVDWSYAEALAFGSLLLEGIPVRLSGEDSVRGTFSQRHLTWWDTESEEPRPYTALQTLAAEQAELSAFDSPLSEHSVLGFEYGYSLVNPHTLTIWEAQFGDFANGAQVVIDNYLVSAEAKWGRLSGLVLLLPHGCEGQGPDHSNAHIERFSQLAACNNIQLCNLTTPAQYFHALRRQVKVRFRKPLVIMAPKSLLRHAQAVSPLADLANGHFEQVLDDTYDPQPVERVLLCSGKVYYDLLAHREETGRTDTAIIRIEQLYPFPAQALAACLERYPGTRQVVWVQEEHKNYGAWAFVHERCADRLPDVALTYHGRDESASSATGSFKEHEQQQKELVESAFETVHSETGRGE